MTPYRVKHADSPTSIARANGVSLAALLAANPHKPQTTVAGVRTWRSLAIGEVVTIPRTVIQPASYGIHDQPIRPESYGAHDHTMSDCPPGQHWDAGYARCAPDVEAARSVIQPTSYGLHAPAGRGGHGGGGHGGGGHGGGGPHPHSGGMMVPHHAGVPHHGVHPHGGGPVMHGHHPHPHPHHRRFFNNRWWGWWPDYGWIVIEQPQTQACVEWGAAIMAPSAELVAFANSMLAQSGGQPIIGTFGAVVYLFTTTAIYPCASFGLYDGLSDGYLGDLQSDASAVVNTAGNDWCTAIKNSGSAFFGAVHQFKVSYNQANSPQNDNIDHGVPLAHNGLYDQATQNAVDATLGQVIAPSACAGGGGGDWKQGLPSDKIADITGKAINLDAQLSAKGCCGCGQQGSDLSNAVMEFKRAIITNPGDWGSSSNAPTVTGSNINVSDPSCQIAFGSEKGGTLKDLTTVLGGSMSYKGTYCAKSDCSCIDTGTNCGAPPPPCSSNSDCPSGQQCVNGKCVTPPGPCQTNADCPSGQTCMGGKCVPVKPPTPGGGGGGGAGALLAGVLLVGGGVAATAFAMKRKKHHAPT
jgi:Cys-rich repeat protein